MEKGGVVHFTESESEMCLLQSMFHTEFAVV